LNALRSRGARGARPSDVSDDRIVIRPIALADIAASRDCVGEVMRERRWLAYVEPFPLADNAAFVARNLTAGNPHYVVADGEMIAGWCDICRQLPPVYAHDATMGMGLREAYRGRGLGERLLRATLDAARAAGLERVSLTVYARNTGAVALYRKVGFAIEGTRVRGKKLDGEYDDVHMMAIHLTGAA
jgi:RimJ/RimL family protein N-acetyltransferase